LLCAILMGGGLRLCEARCEASARVSYRLRNGTISFSGDTLMKHSQVCLRVA
jgi:hypothetical protein